MESRRVFFVAQVEFFRIEVVEMTLARYTPNFSGHGAYKWPKIPWVTG